MKAICTDGLVIDCGNFKAIEGGVVLTEDVKRKRPIGFVPTGELRYVVPDAIADEAARERAQPTAERDTSADTSEPARTSDATGDDGDDGADGADADTLQVTGSAETTVDDDATKAGARRRTRGFDPVAIVAEQVRDEATTRGAEDTEHTERDRDTDSETLDVGRSDPVAVVAAQDADEETDAGEEPDAEGGTNEEEADAEGELRRIDGLGPTYASRLREAGIETLGDLRDADAATVAAAADVGETRAEDWLDQADELA